MTVSSSDLDQHTRVTSQFRRAEVQDGPLGRSWRLLGKSIPPPSASRGASCPVSWPVAQGRSPRPAPPGRGSNRIPDFHGAPVSSLLTLPTDPSPGPTMPFPVSAAFLRWLHCGFEWPCVGQLGLQDASSGPRSPQAEGRPPRRHCGR